MTGWAAVSGDQSDVVEPEMRAGEDQDRKQKRGEKDE